MKSVFQPLTILWILCSAVNCFSLDREAFTITNYNLTVRLEPEQQRLGVRGRITLRNDSQSAQKIAVLQISSSLDWRSIKAGDKPVQFVSQPYTSDIDHTGALSEAVITLPQAVAPKGAVDLELAYEGVIVLDATRLTRIGAPETQARSSDWDQISPTFTGVRGIGFVAWYPIASEAADLSEGNSLLEAVARWKQREAGSRMAIAVNDQGPYDGTPQTVVCDGLEKQGITKEGSAKYAWANCSYNPVGLSVPTLLIGNYKLAEHLNLTSYALPGHESTAEQYSEVAQRVGLVVNDWFGPARFKAMVADLPNEDAPPFESGGMLLTSLASVDPKLSPLVAAHQLTHAALASTRPWIFEGSAHFAQALVVEHANGRQAALDYMVTHAAAFRAAENNVTADQAISRSLVNAGGEESFRAKAMYVWWMLRDMIGERALRKAFATYRPEQDKEPSYMPKLIEMQQQRDLEWFFDDWVYRDRGLPDFKVESVFPRKTLNDSYIVTITVGNLGAAGAEVPVTVKFGGGEIMKRVEVRGKTKGVFRVEIPSLPQEVVVNDGSVPESDTSNNTFRVEVGDKSN